MGLVLALHPIVTGLVIVFFLFVCVLMILTVLIQRPQGGGLSGAFGSGAGSGQTAFGAKTGDALTIATIIVFLIYLVTAVGLNFALRPPAPGATPAGVAQPESAPDAPGTGGEDSGGGGGAGGAEGSGEAEPGAGEGTPPPDGETPAEPDGPGTGEGAGTPGDAGTPEAPGGEPGAPPSEPEPEVPPESPGGPGGRR